VLSVASPRSPRILSSSGLSTSITGACLISENDIGCNFYQAQHWSVTTPAIGKTIEKSLATSNFLLSMCIYVENSGQSAEFLVIYQWN
jgi:hypothetical protein